MFWGGQKFVISKWGHKPKWVGTSAVDIAIFMLLSSLHHPQQSVATVTSSILSII